jgi:hypothetical protein
LLALLFIAGYTSAIGHLASQRGRRWSTGLAALTGLAFVGLTNPWMHGALFVAFAVVGVGAFIVLAWALSAWAVRRPAEPVANVVKPAELEALPAPAALLVPARRVRRVRRRYSLL